MDFLWHRVSKEEREEIKQEAKAIMDRFVNALERAGISDIAEEGFLERESFERDEMHTEKRREEEKDRGKRENGFRDLMFQNAKKVKDGFIVAEKKKW